MAVAVDRVAPIDRSVLEALASPGTSIAATVADSDGAIRCRVDEPLAAMTAAGEAGQLTQYFYFGIQRESSTDSAAGAVRVGPAVTLAYATTRAMQRKPMWPVEVSMACAWRAAGR